MSPSRSRRLEKRQLGLAVGAETVQSLFFPHVLGPLMSFPLWLISHVKLKEALGRGKKDWRDIVREECRAYDMVFKRCTLAGVDSESASTEVEDENVK